MDWSFLTRNKTAITVSTDTRNLPAGCVFFALKGARFNGNLFAVQALETGASYAVVDEDIALTCSMSASYKGRLIRVDNTLLALQELAREWRRQWAAMPPSDGSLKSKTVVAITGTNGKTTTKELTAAVLSTRYHVHFTQGNLNNQVGVPLTLLQLRQEHDIAIVEMGASHPGDIRELVDIAEPDCGLITNVGRAHLEGFGSFEGVQRTKGELYDYLRQHGGFCFRNFDNPYLEVMAAGLKTIGYHSGTMPEGTHLIGSYNSENIQAALTIGSYFGIDHDTALQAVRDYVPKNNRSQLVRTGSNTLIVDAYNANPTSMRAAITSALGQYDAAKLMFVLGDMLELGSYSHLEHQNIVNLLLEQKAENVLLVGKEFAATSAPYPVFADTEQLSGYLTTHSPKGATILIKGSRGMQLEKIIPLL